MCTGVARVANGLPFRMGSWAWVPTNPEGVAPTEGDFFRLAASTCLKIMTSSLRGATVESLRGRETTSASSVTPNKERNVKFDDIFLLTVRRTRYDDVHPRRRLTIDAQAIGLPHLEA